MHRSQNLHHYHHEDSEPGHVYDEQEAIQFRQNVRNLNGALKVASFYFQMHNISEDNFSLFGTNTGINHEMLAGNDERTITKKSKGVNTNELHAKLRINQFVDKGHVSSNKSNIVNLIDDPEFHSHRPAFLNSVMLSSGSAKKTKKEIEKRSVQIIHDQPTQEQQMRHENTKHEHPKHETISLRNSHRLLPEIQETDASGEQTQKHVDRHNHNHNHHEFEELQVRPTNSIGYIIGEKTNSDRYWQQKFEEKPEIPTKVVNFLKPGQRVENLLQSPMDKVLFRPDQHALKVDTNTNTLTIPSYKEAPMTTRENKEVLFSPEKPLKYFNYSANRFRNANGQRSQSPLSQSVKDMSLKNLIDSQLIKVSKGISSGKLSGTSSYLSPKKVISSRVDNEDYGGGYVQTEPNDYYGGSPRDSPVRSGKKGKKEEEVKKKPLKYVVVDAGKRFSMPVTPKLHNKLNVSYKREAENMVNSVKRLNQML